MASNAKRPAKKRSRKKKKTATKRPPWKAILLVVALIAAFGAGIWYARGMPQFEGLRAVADNMRALYTQCLSVEWRPVLYFGDEQSDMLVAEHRTLRTNPGTRNKVAGLVRALIDGPQGTGVRTLPDGVRLRGVQIDGQTAAVDFSDELITRHPGGSSTERITVFSIVNTITDNIQNVTAVRILVAGAPIDTIAGHIDCREPITRDGTCIR